MKEEILTTQDLHLYYGDKEALKGINLNFDEKGITALIGPSGCGKSTYLRTLNRMNDLIPNVTITGTIKFKGNDLYAPNADTVQIRKEIGMVFQQPNPFPFSIYDNVIYGLRIAGEKDKEKLDAVVEKSLRQAAVWDEVKDHLHESALALSGGQQQRVCIARVLAVSPEIILLDEPTSALDPVSSSQIEATLLNLRHDYTIIIVTHNLQQASRIADRTAFFMNGELIEVDQTKNIFMNPANKQTEDYISGRFG
ncbi:MAG: phosphate ABC transporter ATP-binding protein PstB [Levilactobacillus sp.]|jgi:phosphate transport system ATP-binding protein|uniref:Phosphate ABC transporter ATP-binding protein n=1 Tax=Levilactobacillus suantsaiihabitans TaxID=2487722 RepID=A0A4Z0JA96_9LACO|nr:MULTISPECIES: phosphate ABC transporter ATP-binding protein PstB [Levilactobacillus]MCH4124044.1 phosphate ABC transporter ATP-binding protein PstB [Levilactobacillus sp.]MCI1554120.1 phosphate ABC transporter ATP-binding protein PstB [Levilactobacillus sp.]MCI1599324.1 phosphate ABC transporter ATP-binding protein PstB [Levilactobacillus sp.]MCI1605708.1 phosphate ABC transporter ATP-binding protein PstB [Levilactobacillus sp.]TGD19632.1 phosphate ABC transporter ATP-binding protein [Levil